MLSPQLSWLDASGIAPGPRGFPGASWPRARRLLRLPVTPRAARYSRPRRAYLASTAHAWRTPGPCCGTTATCRRRALFVLQRAVRAEACGAHLLAAFGPGFSAYFAAVEH
jgi:hypothetical protein